MSAQLLLSVLAGFSALSIGLFLREYLMRKKLEKGDPASNEEILQKSYQTLHDAIKKSQAILSLAELDSVKTVADTKFYTGKFTKEYEAKLTQAVSDSEKETVTLLNQIKTQVEASQKQFDAYLNDLKAKTDQQTNQVQNTYQQFLTELKNSIQKTEMDTLEVAKQRTNALFEQFEEKMSDFLIQSEQKVMASFDVEMRSARQLIDTYKVQQLSIIDENLIAILEKTLSLVLAKNISLKDQMDLVYESLEKAKAEKFIV